MSQILQVPIMQKKVVNYLHKKLINFFEKNYNPVNVSEVRHTERFWSILKEKVYRNSSKIKYDINQLIYGIIYYLKQIYLTV